MKEHSKKLETNRRNKDTRCFYLLLCLLIKTTNQFLEKCCVPFSQLHCTGELQSDNNRVTQCNSFRNGRLSEEKLKQTGSSQELVSNCTGKVKCKQHKGNVLLNNSHGYLTEKNITRTETLPSFKCHHISIP